MSEMMLLDNAKIRIDHCPKCGASPFKSVPRSQVPRVIARESWADMREGGTGCREMKCSECKEIVGYE